ncbi:tripartite tricarboxylate transporter substrate binding protein [Mycolicibacterium flavescens]|nr:tripartite tricarboxylate transporter substrate binding protein [Mycolicibacterium flavescens]
MHSTRFRTGLAVAAAVGLTVTGCSGVQNTTGSGSGESWPSGTVEMYVGASPGGSSDLISRAVSKGLSDNLGASFPVINREGANGALAAAEIVNAEPDGSKIAIQNASLFTITPLAVAPDEVTNIDDFDVVQGVSRDDYVLVTNPASGFRTIADMQNAPDRVVRYGTTGVGTGAQLSAALLFKTSNINAQAVPFDGGAPALAAVLGNQVDVASLQVGEAIENIQAQKLVPLAVFGPERIEYLPDVPTAKEQGLDVEVTQYRFMTVPKGTPQEVKDRLVEGMQATFATEEYKQFNKQNSLTPMEIPGDEVLEHLREDKQRYADLVGQYGISLREEGSS